jgi:hypothetical protein
MEVSGGEQISIHFLGDYVGYNKYEYEATRSVSGPCNEAVSGTFVENSAWSFSWGTTTTVGGGVTGSAPKGSGTITGTVATSLGISINSGIQQRLNFNCGTKDCTKATAVLRIAVTEISGVYSDVHFLIGTFTDYEFHAATIVFLGWDCEYEDCPDGCEGTDGGEPPLGDTYDEYDDIDDFHLF